MDPLRQPLLSFHGLEGFSFVWKQQVFFEQVEDQHLRSKLRSNLSVTTQVKTLWDHLLVKNSGNKPYPDPYL